MHICFESLASYKTKVAGVVIKIVIRPALEGVAMMQADEAIRLEDTGTIAHSRKVAHMIDGLNYVLVETIQVYTNNISKKFVNSLKLGGLLHDIGKSRVPLSILNKKARLTSEEYEVIKKHTQYGADILKSGIDINIEYDAQVLYNMVVYHHERWDGLGYPYRLSGLDIPIESRITAILDTYEAIRSERPYKTALSHSEAITEIERCSGTQFDASLVKEFVRREKLVNNLYGNVQ